MTDNDIEKWWSLVKAGGPNIGIAQGIYKAQNDDTKQKIQKFFMRNCLKAIYKEAYKDVGIVSGCPSVWIGVSGCSSVWIGDLKIYMNYSSRNPSLIGRKLAFDFQNVQWNVSHLSIKLAHNTMVCECGLPPIHKTKSNDTFGEIKKIANVWAGYFRIDNFGHPDTFENFFNTEFYDR
jgi:hypothetical protein